MFKSKFILLGVLTLGASLSQALPRLEKVDGAQILSVISKSCPDQFSEAMQGANAVDKVTFVEKVNGRKTLWRYQITTVKRTPPPFFNTEKIAVLTIDWRSAEEGHSTPDRGTIWNITCTIQR